MLREVLLQARHFLEQARAFARGARSRLPALQTRARTNHEATQQWLQETRRRLLVAAVSDALREARNPRTSGERLPVLALRDETGEVMRAALCNPSFPRGELRMVLLDTTAPVGPDQVAACQNPAVAALLRVEPLSPYQDAALRVLEYLARQAQDASHETDERTFEQRILEWSFRSAGEEGHAHRSEARAFARHLARLFGLPWPEEP